MKFTAHRSDLLDALLTAGRAASVRSAFGAAYVSLDISDGVLTAVGTDSDLTIATVTGANGDDGSVNLPSRLIADIVKSLDADEVSVVVDDTEATIRAGRAEFVVRTVADATNLAIPAIGATPVTVDATAFAEGLRQVIPAALKDDTRAPQLTGVCVETTETGIRLVATDSYRLAIKDIEGLSVPVDDEPALIPARALSEVQRLLDGAETFKIARTDLAASFVIGATRVTTRLLRGPFPDYARLIPEGYPSAFTADRSALLAAIKRVRIMVTNTKDATTPVRLSFFSDGLTLEVRTAETGNATEQVAGNLRGDEGAVAFNPQYLIDGLECATGESVNLSFIDNSKPATVSGASDGYRTLLMPVRVS